MAIHDDLPGEAGRAASQPPGANVNAELDGRTVRPPGFIVPLDIDARGRVTEPLLVPSYGACIHVPPPPANQVVLVTPAQQPLEPRGEGRGLPAHGPPAGRVSQDRPGRVLVRARGRHG